MFFVERSNDSFNFPLGLIKHIVLVLVLMCFDRPDISTSLSASVQVTVKFKGQTSQQPVEHSLDAGVTLKHIINNDFMLHGATKHKRSVYVTSDDEVHVQAFYQVADTSVNSFGG